MKPTSVRSSVSQSEVGSQSVRSSVSQSEVGSQSVRSRKSLPAAPAAADAVVAVSGSSHRGTPGLCDTMAQRPPPHTHTHRTMKRRNGRAASVDGARDRSRRRDLAESRETSGGGTSALAGLIGARVGEAKEAREEVVVPYRGSRRWGSCGFRRRPRWRRCS